MKNMRTRFRAQLAAFAACCLQPCMPASSAPLPDTWTGTVTYVVDGDTVRVRPPGGGKPVSVRVYGIDAPEICQAGGKASRDALARRILGKPVLVVGKHRDNYGRLLAQLKDGKDDLGGWMVSQGQAWSYRFQRSNGPYSSEQAGAQAARRGLFSGASGAAGPLYPAQFRKQHGFCNPRNPDAPPFRP
jgi:micrococcal nuclease